MKCGDTVTLTIDSVAFGGSGIGRVNNRVVFVPFTVGGDIVEAEVTEVKKRYLRGRVQKISRSSPKRTDPKCRFYYHCGGCQYQHIDYEHQLEIKQRQVVDSFERIGKIASPPVKDIIPSPQMYGYRGKAEYHLGWTPEKHPVMGFLDTRGTSLIDITRCEIVHESINTACLHFRDDLVSGKRKVHDDRITFWSEGNNRQSDGGHFAFDTVTRTVKDSVLYVPFEGFFQANISLVDTLVDEVMSRCKLSDSNSIVDCYCGSGLFMLFSSPLVKQCYGIEMDAEAVECARYNLRLHNLSNTEMFQGTVEGVVRRNDFGRRHIDTVILDPPRTGCAHDALKGIADLNPSRIVYVSCNPASQARDIRYLIERGFSLVGLQPMDMFPQTKHIEVIALLIQDQHA